ncbi:MAG: TldD/PmbA family protein [Leptolyngbya sp. SIO4C1]|nr:TldD/PmbA family protein [Leptolyngbya sp. SIO4C1]
MGAAIVNSTETLDLPEQLLALAKASGAEAAEVFQSQTFSQPVIFEANRLKQLETSESEGIALRLWRQGRPGLAVAYGPVAPQRLVERALQLSQLNQPEQPELTAGQQQQFPTLGEAVSVAQLIDWGQAAIEQIRAAYPEVICQAELDCETEVTRLVNSAGLDYAYQDTTLSGYWSADWIRGDDFLSVGDGEVARYRLNPQLVVADILQRLSWAEQTVEPLSGRLPVVFTAKATDLLWGTVQSALNGKRIVEQASPWSDALQQPVVSAALTLYQDPTQGPYSCPFDDEGTLAQRLQLIDSGRLTQIYCDRKVGRQLGQASTGSGFRPGLGSYPVPSLLNLLIQPGERSFEQMISCLGEAIVVDQVLGNSAGISGELSVNLELGYRVINGEIAGRVKDTMVAGNVYTALKQVIELAADAAWNGACFTPALVVDGLSVTGRL